MLVRPLLLAAFCAITALAACGGGGVVTTPLAPGGTFTAVPLATLPPFDVTQDAASVPVPASTGAGAPPITIPLPSTAQVVNEVDLSGVDADIPNGTTVDEEATDAEPSDAPAPDGAARDAADAVRFTLAGTVRKHIETVSLKFSQKVVLKTRPTFVFTFASGFLIPANYYLQYFDTSDPGQGWIDPFEGPATVNGSTLLFVDTKNAFTFQARVKYEFDLYAMSSRASPTPVPATPTPVASGSAPSPTPSPIFGLLSVTPTSFAFTAAGQTQTLVVSEDGYAGAFSATVADTSIATVAGGGNGVFVVTATANPGSSHVTISDEHGQTVNVPFTVTITTGTISSRGRR
jgi:hypothetical protein